PIPTPPRSTLFPYTTLFRSWNLALSGAALEAVAMGSTRIWDTKSRTMGLNFTADYPPTGIHNWNQFGSQLSKTKNRVLDVMNARSEEHTSELQSRFDLVCRL